MIAAAAATVSSSCTDRSVAAPTEIAGPRFDMECDPNQQSMSCLAQNNMECNSNQAYLIWYCGTYLGPGNSSIIILVSYYPEPNWPIYTPPPPCGDERDVIIGEYKARPIIGFVPACSDITNTGGSANFSWAEVNGGFQTGSQHSPWGIFSATAGLEATRTAYARGAIRIASGYRCPVGNSASGGVTKSRHMRGNAADMYSYAYPWTEDEFNRLRTAAASTGTTELLSWDTYSDHHLHAAW